MPPPQQIGRYRLVRPLGAGAFAMVWLAHDDTLEAPVAVKVMAENWAYRLDLRERFLAEARLLRRAACSRLVQVFDMGELPDERPYFVMEYADRGTLEDLLADGPLPLHDALRLTAEAARGVAALHEAGVVHRDIKPSNVLIGTARDGTQRILVADLGLAKALAQASGLTMIAGSAGYMAPEQATRDGGVDVRADVYGLGAVLYHLLTGTVPGPPGRITRPDRLRTGLPADVRRAVLRALRTDRRKRWPDAGHFAAELEALAARHDRPATGGALRRLREHRRASVLALCAVLAAAATGAGLLATRTAPPRTPATVAVSDSSGRITVTVPAAWSRELVAGGWSPKTLGLPGGQEPGLVIAGDASRWPDLDARVDGVFVGLSEHGDLAGRVGAIRHDLCRRRQSRGYRSTKWSGQVRHWTACGTAGGSIDEISLGRDGAAQPQVYVQVRQEGGADMTDTVLDGLDISS